MQMLLGGLREVSAFSVQRLAIYLATLSQDDNKPMLRPVDTSERRFECVENPMFHKLFEEVADGRQRLWSQGGCKQAPLLSTRDEEQRQPRATGPQLATAMLAGWCKSCLTPPGC
jgi:hypothetical protein